MNQNGFWENLSQRVTPAASHLHRQRQQRQQTQTKTFVFRLLLTELHLQKKKKKKKKKLMMKVTSLVLSCFIVSASAFNPAGDVNRREIFQSIAAAGVTAVVGANPSVVNAIDACPKGSSNCIRTTWTPPSGTSKADATAALRTILESYPQAGQEKVDLGGWSFAEDNLSGGSARIEYKSGIGNFAKFFNGGKPFVDDLTVEVASNGVVEVKSSSRVGDSDMGVNQKRLDYLVSKLRAEGWTAPDPKY